MKKLHNQLSLCLLIALILLCLVWELWLAPLPTVSGVPWLAIKVLPLVLAIPGFWAGRLYTFKWMSLAVWLFFVEGTVRGWSDTGPSSSLAWIEAVLSVGLFAAILFSIRQMRKLS